MKELFEKSGIFYRENEPLSKHTSFRIGGPARWYAEPDGAVQLAALLAALREKGVRHTVMGNGSNLLVPDAGFDGVVIAVGSRMSGISAEGCRIRAEAGALLSRVAHTAMEHGLTGLEFAHGIPGSLGGGIFMNAGAYGGELKDVVRQVEYLDEELRSRALRGEDAGFVYRGSLFKARRGSIILAAELELQQGDRESIAQTMRELAGRRREKQPLEYPSAGSTFKRPEGDYAARLIEACGLKGLRVGGAEVSQKHAGFVINRGGATCADVLSLCRQIEEIVWQRCGVRLEREVELLGGGIAEDGAGTL
ncbi:MAG: UDP-N-acetylmuramate dehydrogenase [Clostridia bacterium]|nr:UDP-N-acetylmuramate dehydrogenase [Clostridia bacterium]